MKVHSAAPAKQSLQNPRIEDDRLQRVTSNITFTDNRPEAIVLRKQSGIINNSSRVLQQKAINQRIQHSPHMVTQRMQHEALLNGSEKLDNGSKHTIMPKLDLSKAVKTQVHLDSALTPAVPLKKPLQSKSQQQNVAVFDARGSILPIQRFMDPVTHEEINIEEIQYLGIVLNYMEMLSKGTLELDKEERTALFYKRAELLRKDKLKEKIADSNQELMEQANHSGKVAYLHNVGNETLRNMIRSGVNPQLGFADPRFFAQPDKFTWRLLPNISASAGIRAFLNPTYASNANPGITIAECQTTIQAIFYHTILNMIGDRRFDQTFGKAGATLPDEKRLLIEFQMSSKNPLKHFLADEKATMDKEEMGGLGLQHEEDGEVPVSAPGFRPAKLGGWYFIKNHALYNIRHSEGIWGGENALFVGYNEENEQLFSGFGLENRTEAEMAVSLAETFNDPPTAGEVENILKNYPGHISLVLPQLGNPNSLEQLPDLTPGAIAALVNLRKQQGGPFANIPLAGHRQQLLALRGLLKGIALQPPVRPGDLLAEIHLQDVEGGEVEPAVTHGTWSNTENAKILTWTNSRLKRISIRTLMDYYASAFDLNLSHLLRDLIKGLNQEIANKAENAKFDVAVGDTFLFPLPSTLAKLKKTPGGFQALGSKIISPEKLQELVKNS